MFKLRIYCRYKGFITSFTGNSVEDCERKAKEAATKSVAATASCVEDQWAHSDHV